MKALLLIFAVLSSLTLPVNAWVTDEEANPTPHEEYEAPKAEFLVQEIAGMLIQDIQVKYIIKSSRGKDFIRDLHGSTSISLPRGMYKIVGDGVLPISIIEAEDAKRMIIDYYVWTSIEEKEDPKLVAVTLYGHEKKSEVKKEELEDMKMEIAKHKAYFKWFRHYYDRLNSEEVLPEQVLSLEEFNKAVADGTIEAEELD